MTEAWAKELAKHPFHSRKWTEFKLFYRQTGNRNFPDERESQAIQAQGSKRDSFDLQENQPALAQAGRSKAGKLCFRQEDQPWRWQVDISTG